MATPGERARRDEHGRLHYTPEAGDVVVMRKPHVCGAERMAVTLVGLDVRLSCTGCGARVVLSRARLRSQVAQVDGTVADQPGSDG